jgi:quercetin dioxygenase-like cupin family protein
VSIDELFDVEAAKASAEPQARASTLAGSTPQRVELASTGTSDTAATSAGDGRGDPEVADSPVSRSALASPADAWPPSAGSSPRLSVTRPGERTRLVMDSGVIWEQLARNTGQDLDFMEIIYPPGSSSTNDDRMLRHEGYEFGYLLEGELEVTFGFDVFVLKPGQSLGLDSSMPHLFKNLGSVSARGIWCVHHRRH